MKKRILSALMALCMVVTMTPTAAFAAVGEEAPGSSSSVCPHHVHDAACGYSEGTPCNHVHDANCGYTEGTPAVEAVAEIPCDKNCPVSEDGTVVHAADCAYTPAVEAKAAVPGTPCNHVHDETCGYRAGTPCTFDAADCEICNPQNSGEKQITAWSFVDPDGYLTEDSGAFYLALPGVSEENPVSPADITSMLPAELTATVGDASETLALTWQSADFIADETGSYPTGGNYTFTAALPEEYTLAEGAPALSVTVQLGGAQLLSAPSDLTPAQVLEQLNTQNNTAITLSTKGQTLGSWSPASSPSNAVYLRLPARVSEPGRDNYWPGGIISMKIAKSDKARLFQVDITAAETGTAYLVVDTVDRAFTPMTDPTAASTHGLITSIRSGSGTLGYVLEANKDYYISVQFINGLSDSVDYGYDMFQEHAVSNLRLTNVSSSTVTYAVKDANTGYLHRSDDTTSVNMSTSITGDSVDYLEQGTVQVDPVPKPGYQFDHWEWTTTEDQTFTDTTSRHYAWTNNNYATEKKSIVVYAVFKSGRSNVNSSFFNTSGTNYTSYEPQWTVDGFTSNASGGLDSYIVGSLSSSDVTHRLETTLYLKEATDLFFTSNSDLTQSSSVSISVDGKKATMYIDSSFLGEASFNDQTTTGNTGMIRKYYYRIPAGVHTLSITHAKVGTGWGSSPHTGTWTLKDLRLVPAASSGPTVTIQKVSEAGSAISAGTLTATFGYTSENYKTETIGSSKTYSFSSIVSGDNQIMVKAEDSEGNAFLRWDIFDKNGVLTDTSTSRYIYRLFTDTEAHTIKAVFATTSDPSSDHYQVTQAITGQTNPYDGTAFDQSVCTISKDAPLLWANYKYVGYSMSSGLMISKSYETQTSFKITSADAMLSFDYKLTLVPSFYYKSYSVSVDQLQADGSWATVNTQELFPTEFDTYYYQFPAAGTYRLRFGSAITDDITGSFVRNLHISKNPKNSLTVAASISADGSANAAFLTAVKNTSGAIMTGQTVSSKTSYSLYAPPLVTYSGSQYAFDHWVLKNNSYDAIPYGERANFIYNAKGCGSYTLTAVYVDATNQADFNAKLFNTTNEIKGITFSKFPNFTFQDVITSNGSTVKDCLFSAGRTNWNMTSDQLIISPRTVVISLAVEYSEVSVEAVAQDGTVIATAGAAYTEDATSGFSGDYRYAKVLQVAPGTPFYLRITYPGSYSTGCYIKDLRINTIPTYQLTQLLTSAYWGTYGSSRTMESDTINSLIRDMTVKKVGDATTLSGSALAAAAGVAEDTKISFNAVIDDFAAGNNKPIYTNFVWSNVGNADFLSAAFPSNAMSITSSTATAVSTTDPTDPAFDGVHVAQRILGYFALSQEVAGVPYTGTDYTVIIPKGTVAPALAATLEESRLNQGLLAGDSISLVLEDDIKGEYSLNDLNCLYMRNSSKFHLEGKNAANYQLDEYQQATLQLPSPFKLSKTEILASLTTDSDKNNIKKLLTAKEYDGTSSLTTPVYKTIANAVDTKGNWIYFYKNWVDVQSAELCDADGNPISYDPSGNYNVKITLKTTSDSYVYFGTDNFFILQNCGNLVTPHTLTTDDLVSLTATKEYDSTSTFTNVAPQFCVGSDTIVCADATATVSSQNTGTYYAADLSGLVLPDGINSGMVTLPEDGTLPGAGGEIELTNPQDPTGDKIKRQIVILKTEGTKLADGDAVLVGSDTLTFTGSAIEPGVTVTSDGNLLTKDTDYTVTYKNNINTAAASDANAPTVIVTGIGQYSDTVNLPFTIEKAGVTVPTIDSKVYTGETQTAAVAADSRYTVVNDGGINAGDYDVVLTLADKANTAWTTGDADGNGVVTLTFRIAKKTVDALALGAILTAPVKNGAPQTDINTAQYTGTVSWTDADGSAVGSKFLGGIVYKASLALAATDNYTLTGVAANSFTHAGASSVTNAADSGTGTVVFLATADRTATTVLAAGMPTKTVYRIGETFDAAGTTITATYDDGTSGTITGGYSVNPAVMAADTTSVTLTYGGVTTAPITVSVMENLTSITAPAAISGVMNGAAKTADALHLPTTVGITTSTGQTTTAAVSWDLANAAYDAASTAAQSFTVTGTVALPADVSNVTGAALTAAVSVSVNAAAKVTPPEADTGTNPADTEEKVTGLEENALLTVGDLIPLSVDSFTRGANVYLPAEWQTNPHGTFAPAGGTTYTATVDTTGMSVGAHTLVITYREVVAATGIATGNMVQTSIAYTLQAKPAPSTTDPAASYMITATAGAGGDISTGKYVQVGIGESAGFTFTPHKGYQIADVLVNGKSVGAMTGYVFTNVLSNQTIHVTFKATGHTNPQTGSYLSDEMSHPAVWVGLLVLCVSGVGIFDAVKKRKKASNG